MRAERPERSLRDVTKVHLASRVRPALRAQVSVLVDGHLWLPVAHLCVQHGTTRIRADPLLILGTHNLLCVRDGLNVARTWEPLSPSESSTMRAAQKVWKAAEDGRVTTFRQLQQVQGGQALPNLLSSRLRHPSRARVAGSGVSGQEGQQEEPGQEVVSAVFDTVLHLLQEVHLRTQ